MLTTIHNITLGLKLLFKEIDDKQEACRRVSFNTVAITLTIFFAIFEALMFFQEDLGAGDIAVVELCMTLFLTICLIVSTCLFEKMLNKSAIQFELVAEKRTMRLQSISFCVGFLIRSIYDFS